jgi:hypothetical protein
MYTETDTPRHVQGVELSNCVVDPLTMRQADRLRKAFGLNGLFHLPFLQSEGRELKWGIISVGYDDGSRRVVPPSQYYNKVLVALISQLLQNFYGEIMAGNVSGFRRQSIVAVALYLTDALETAGWSLLNCRANDEKTNHLTAVIQKSVELIEQGASFSNWELAILRGELAIANCIGSARPDIHHKHSAA